MPMIVWWRKPPSAKERPDGRALVAARVCVVGPWIYLVVALPVAILAPITGLAAFWGCGSWWSRLCQVWSPWSSGTPTVIRTANSP
ncbi:hypothetical protein [Saccharopolyspora sp. NPDC002376]